MIALLRLATFELRFQLRRVATWVYCLAFALIAFVVVAAAGGAFGADTGSAISIINSPSRVWQMLHLVSLLGVPVTAAIAGSAGQRDFQTGSYPLFFTTPIRPAAYLAGRWLGAVAANLVIFLGGVVGILAACAWPTVDHGRVGPIHLADYAAPLALAVLPNLLFTAALFVTLTALSRRMLAAYAGGFALLIGWGIAQLFVTSLDAERVSLLGDPFGFGPIRLATRYWTVVEQNTLPIPAGGWFLYNRLLWLGVGAAVFALGAFLFRFTHLAGEGRAQGWQPDVPEPVPAPLALPPATRDFGTGARLRQLAAETRRSVREVVANVWFPILIGLSLLFVIAAGSQLGSIYGTVTYPVTYKVVELVQGTFALFVLIIITFYSGELIWNERESHAAGIHDALPVPTWVPFLARFLALLLVVVAIQAAAMGCGIALQLARGYTHIEPGQYLFGLFVESLVGSYLPLLFLAVLVQTLLNHKYLGYLVTILVFVGQGLLYYLLGVHHNLLIYGGTPGLVYSDMNGYGHALRAWGWFAFYWAAVGAMLLLAASLFQVRGQETGVRWRLRLARRRASAPLLATGAGLLALVLATGGWIFYNTNLLNHYEPQRASERIQASYEKLYKRFEWAPQPRITAAVLRVEIYPESRDLLLRGRYTLVNRTAAPLDSLHVDVVNSLKVRRLAPDRASARVLSDSARGYYVFRLARPLAPGDSLHLDFDLADLERGFANEPSWQPVVNNGTFFNNHWLPHIGYNAEGELSDEGERKRYGLGRRPRAASLHDARARTRNFVSSDADWIAFDVTVGTSADQAALAPGYLQSSWTRGGRRWFRYRMDAPILDFYAILSGRYRVRRDRWRGQPVEVWYHPGHEYNLATMRRAAREALEYCSREFGPYQHHQLRIVEFPRYAEFAQSFDNTVPYSEAIGFIADVHRDDIDYPYFVTAHEVAHQWWGHQEAPADVQGAAMLSETLAEYTALMVMEKAYGREKIGRFLRYELSHYLEGRGNEQRAEQPLMTVENQQYIHYNKGALAMYALRDYLGEAAVNRALREFLAEWRFRGPPYPTSLDLLAHLRATAPDSLRPVVDDLFAHVTLWENRATWATWRPLPGGGYRVVLNASARKLRADSLGAETPQRVDDWIDVGVFAGDSLVALRKLRFDGGAQAVTFDLKVQPDSAGIDPLHKLIDRVLDDNVMVVTRSTARGARGPAPPRTDAHVRRAATASKR